MRPTAKGLYIDVGTAAQTMHLAAHALGLGAGVVTSFSQAAVIRVLNIPGHLTPEMFVCLGYPAAIANMLGIGALFLGLGYILRWVDGRLGIARA